MIHNVYRTRNLPSTSSENQPPDEPLPLDTHEIFSFVSAAISDDSADHILVGDFNIHHPNWGGPRVIPHRASQLLLSLQELHNLSLLLPPEIITFKRHGGESTIDLVFSSSDLMNSLTACCLREDLDHGSDHYPIETSFLLSPHIFPQVQEPLWRKADTATL
jgi:endonuclease/exonuclease/phosphatase family metal-dependent hydrolase